MPLLFVIAILKTEIRFVKLQYVAAHCNRVKCGLLVKSKVWKAKDLELANVFSNKKKGRQYETVYL